MTLGRMWSWSRLGYFGTGRLRLYHSECSLPAFAGDLEGRELHPQMQELCNCASSGVGVAQFLFCLVCAFVFLRGSGGKNSFCIVKIC